MIEIVADNEREQADRGEDPRQPTSDAQPTHQRKRSAAVVVGDKDDDDVEFDAFEEDVVVVVVDGDEIGMPE